MTNIKEQAVRIAFSILEMAEKDYITAGERMDAADKAVRKELSELTGLHPNQIILYPRDCLVSPHGCCVVDAAKGFNYRKCIFCKKEEK